MEFKNNLTTEEEAKHRWTQIMQMICGSKADYQDLKRIIARYQFQYNYDDLTGKVTMKQRHAKMKCDRCKPDLQSSQRAQALVDKPKRSSVVFCQ